LHRRGVAPYNPPGMEPPEAGPAPRWIREVSRARKRVTRILRQGRHFRIEDLEPRVRALLKAYRKCVQMNDLMLAYAMEHAPEAEPREQEELRGLLEQFDVTRIQGDHTAAEWLESVADMVEVKREWVSLVRERLPDVVALARRISRRAPAEPEEEELGRMARDFLDLVEGPKLDQTLREMEREERRCVACAREIRGVAEELNERCARQMLDRRRRRADAGPA
jgi:hypothetical protein